MIVCIDTNVLLQAAKPDHPFHVIFAGWLQRKFRWAISNDVLTEYEEIITQRSGTMARVVSPGVHLPSMSSRSIRAAAA